MALSPGTRLGVYEITAQIGEGGMGQVYQLGRVREAEAALLKAQDLDPADPEIVYALGMFFTSQQQWKQAQLYAEKLVELTPGQPGPRQLVDRIKQLAAAAR